MTGYLKRNKLTHTESLIYHCPVI